MKTAAVFTALSIMLILSGAPAFAGKQEMTEEELARTKEVNAININDVMVTELSAKMDPPYRPRQLMIIFEPLGSGSAQDQGCPIRGCGDNPGGSRSFPSFRFFPLFK